MAISNELSALLETILDHINDDQAVGDILTDRLDQAERTTTPAKRQRTSDMAAGREAARKRFGTDA